MEGGRGGEREERREMEEREMREGKSTYTHTSNHKGMAINTPENAPRTVGTLNKLHSVTTLMQEEGS